MRIERGVLRTVPQSALQLGLIRHNAARWSTVMNDTTTQWSGSSNQEGC